MSGAYRNWTTGHPDRKFLEHGEIFREDCVVLITHVNSTREGGWADLACTKTRPSVCKKGKSSGILFFS